MKNTQLDSTQPKPALVIVEKTRTALTSVLFIQTPATSGIWRGVLWQSDDLQRGLAPLEGRRGAEGTRRSRGNDSLCLYLSIYTHSDTHGTCYHLSCVQREQRWRAGDGQCAILAPRAWSSCLNWHYLICLLLYTHMNRLHTQYITVMEKKATETSGLLIRVAE